MQASWVDGFDQRVLLSRFVHLANTGGLVGFDGEAKNFVTLLRSMVQFPEAVPWGVRYELLEEASRSAANAGATTPKELLAHIQAGFKAYAAMPRKKYVLFTSITIAPDNKLGQHRRQRREAELPWPRCQGRQMTRAALYPSIEAGCLWRRSRGCWSSRRKSKRGRPRRRLRDR